MLTTFKGWFRQKKKENCWFCCQDQDVDSSQSEWWKCKFCDQYNGFLEDGDYRYPVPGMYSSAYNPSNLNVTDDMVSMQNHKRSNLIRRTNPSVKRPIVNLHQSMNSKSIFCPQCSDTLALKVRQAAIFVPINPANYKKEYDDHKHMLEKQYPLCNRCEQNVHYELMRQNSVFQQNIPIDSFKKVNYCESRSLKLLPNEAVSSIQGIQRSSESEDCSMNKQQIKNSYIFKNILVFSLISIRLLTNIYLIASRLTIILDYSSRDLDTNNNSKSISFWSFTRFYCCYAYIAVVIMIFSDALLCILRVDTDELKFQFLLLTTNLIAYYSQYFSLKLISLFQI
ncbi:hypothetical protein GJ496_006291 [Pomphorhynchus laevis]|nr:hypothetical protein GJ496_006291 [Pomphorhynchus laevis]